MDCKRAEALFVDFYDGTLKGADRSELERHLEQCPSCRRSWEIYQQTIREVSGLNVLSDPDEFVKNVQQKINHRSKGRFFNDQAPYTVRFAVVSFLLIFVFLIAYLILALSSDIQLVIRETDGGLAADASESKH